jgi:transcriptional regulator NrdR family protein
MRGMGCPGCTSTETQVVDSRPSFGSIRRRRECQDCGTRFTTHEYHERAINARDAAVESRVMARVGSRLMLAARR